MKFNDPDRFQNRPRAVLFDLWMIGDDPEADIRGAREAVGAVTLQKVHPGVSKGREAAAPDAWFDSFRELRDFMKGKDFTSGAGVGVR